MSGAKFQPPQERITNFMEVALGYTRKQAMAEAARCLQCKKPACVKGCPVEVPIKDFIGCLQKDDLEGAYRTIKGTNSLPAVPTWSTRGPAMQCR